MQNQPVATVALPELQDTSNGDALAISNVIEYDFNVTSPQYPWVCKHNGSLSFTCPFDGNPMVINMGSKRMGCKNIAHCKAFSLDTAAYQAIVQKGFLNMDSIPEGFRAKLNGVEVTAAHPQTDKPMSERLAIPICKCCGGCRLFIGSNEQWVSSYGIVAFRCGVLDLHRDVQKNSVCKKLNVPLKEMTNISGFEPEDSAFGKNKNKYGQTLHAFDMQRYFGATITKINSNDSKIVPIIETMTFDVL